MTCRAKFLSLLSPVFGVRLEMGGWLFKFSISSKFPYFSANFLICDLGSFLLSEFIYNILNIWNSRLSQVQLQWEKGKKGWVDFSVWLRFCSLGKESRSGRAGQSAPRTVKRKNAHAPQTTNERATWSRRTNRATDFNWRRKAPEKIIEHKYR